MGQLGKEKRLREDRLVGIKTGVPSYIPPELETRGFKLVFYDVSDNKIGEIGSDSFRGKIAEIQFELISFGCGAFSFTINDLPDFNITYRTRVDIHPYFDSIPWFTGFIQVIPKPGKKRPYTFSGFGYFEQLDWVTITASYQNQEVSLIIKDIIQNYVAPNTQIIYNEAKIETTSYTITSIDFDHTKAKDALQTLADIAQSYEFGVDNSREFYFRAIDTETRYHYWVGKQFQDIEIEEDPNSVRNKLYVKAGQISGGSNIIGSVQDNTSISTYGLREDVITAPEILDSSDALQWANYILQDLKDPKVRAQIHNVFLDSTKEKIEPKGKCRITVYDGTEYQLAVKRVLYSISKSGILAELELGEIQEPFEKQIVDIVKEIDEEKRLSDKRTDQLYDLASNPGSHQHVRADITDFWDSPFWNNIPDKPSTFPPDAHSHVKADITDFAHTHPGTEITSQVSDSDKVDGYDASDLVKKSGDNMQGDLDLGDNFIKRGILLDSRDYYYYGLSLEDNILALAVEKGYTVTASESPDAGFLKYMFTSSFPNYAKWDDSLTTYPLTITIENFGTIHYSTYFWIHFAWNRKPDSGYKIEVYTSDDASWHTVADTTSASQTNVHFYVDSYITKLRITIKSGNSTYGAIQIGQIGFAARYRYRRDYGWGLSKEGDTMYGDLTMAAGKKINFGSYYLNSLVANNKVPDSDKLDGYHASSFALASHTHFVYSVADISVSYDSWVTVTVSGAKAVVVTVDFGTTNDVYKGAIVKFRKYGSSADYEAKAQGVSRFSMTIIVPCDGSGRFQYYAQRDAGSITLKRVGYFT